MKFSELKALVDKLENEVGVDPEAEVCIRHKGDFEQVLEGGNYQRFKVTFADGESEEIHEQDLDYYRGLDDYMHEEVVETILYFSTGR